MPSVDETDDELLTDAEGGRLLKVGQTKFLEMQKSPGFPDPVWLGPRGKRHWRRKLLAYVAKLDSRPLELRKARVTA